MKTRICIVCAATLATAAGLAQGQVTNGNFETGNFSGWTQFGDTSYTGVQAGTVHSGTWATEAGPTGAIGGIQQVLSATPGQQMLIEFWYQALGDENSFTASVGGQVLVSFINDTAHTSWTHFSYGIAAPTANPILKFEFFNPPSYDYLDDVTVVIGALGACCLPDGSCIVQSAGGCASVSGLYRGDGVQCANANCPQPPSGACCKVDGSCSFITQGQCTAIPSAVYRGDNVLCASVTCLPSGYTEQGDAGDLPANAAVISGPGGAPMTQIQGTIGGPADVDMFKIQICNHGTFAASLVGHASFDTQIWLFSGAGKGVTCNDDANATSTQSAIGHQFVNTDGAYFVAVSAYNRDARDASGQLLWQNAPFTVEHAADGPGAQNPITVWDTGTTDPGGVYQMTLVGACFVPTAAACYANCDNSTAAPILNANDFQCFLNQFASSDPRANCDGSTAVPTLNANDFQCFLNAFASGCS